MLVIRIDLPDLIEAHDALMAENLELRKENEEPRARKRGDGWACERVSKWWGIQRFETKVKRGYPQKSTPTRETESCVGMKPKVLNKGSI